MRRLEEPVSMTLYSPRQYIARRTQQYSTAVTPRRTFTSNLHHNNHAQPDSYQPTTPAFASSQIEGPEGCRRFTAESRAANESEEEGGRCIEAARRLYSVSKRWMLLLHTNPLLNG